MKRAKLIYLIDDGFTIGISIHDQGWIWLGIIGIRLW